MNALSGEKRKSSERLFKASHWNVSNGQHNDLPVRAGASRQPHLSRSGGARVIRLIFAPTPGDPLRKRVRYRSPDHAARSTLTYLRVSNVPPGYVVSALALKA